MAKPNKGAAELKRMRAAARAAAPKVTDANSAAGAHPNRGAIADEQVEQRADAPLQKNVKFDPYHGETPETPGAHDDK